MGQGSPCRTCSNTDTSLSRTSSRAPECQAGNALACSGWPAPRPAIPLLLLTQLSSPPVGQREPSFPLLGQERQGAPTARELHLTPEDSQMTL